MTLEGLRHFIGSISYFPDGQRMISGSDDKTTRQWDLKEGKEIEEVRDVCEERVRAVAVSSDSRWIVTGGGNWDVLDSAELKVCEVEMGTTKKLQGHSDVINCIDISADNMQLASGSDDRTARIWNLETGKLVAAKKTILTPSMTLKGHGGYIESMSYFPDGQRMISGSNDKTARQWDLKTGKEIEGAQGHGNWIQSMSYFPDGQRMISGSDDKTARQWDLKEGKETEEGWDGCENVWAVAVSRDGRWIVTGGGPDGYFNSGELKVCEVETGTVKKLQGHSRRISCLDVSALGWPPC
ncbi:hypothetical protein CY34DRAFT_84739 [Suillus luteus UH-Slu-Lm8-n1]|uniref:WD40 repeat-like protein n=1 Tax=Suillus luteus UH-Slu-Lm8-n1 TaxID=930992 RepID=A0A0C9ZVD6_9AGAM|nr:hypothetical protein CY34DRAFT_84739 [Suillus luteus UH-Slu-Lm8-n1]